MNATLCRGLPKQAMFWRVPVTQLSPPAGRLGVLVVDDEDSVRSLLRALLGSLGYRVWQAASGPEALVIYQRYRSQIDLVLLDVRMPGWDGPRTLSALQRLDPSVRCCFMSAETGRYTVADFYGRGALGFLPKPFSLKQVVQTIGRLAGFQPAAAI